jgi:CheY-like chemotaxis protein
MVANGVEAWIALRGSNYDLLVTDNTMPRVTGMELIKNLRSEDMSIPVILASGTAPMEDLKRNSWLNIDALLSKPFSPGKLLETVIEVLNAVDKVANSAKLFRDCAMQDEHISPAAKPASPPVPERINLSYRILVVDDDKDTRQLSMDVLTDFGYEVEGVTDGAAGWAALQASNDYDMVVTDNHMPKMTGMEMIAKLRSARMPVPVVLATGNLPTHIISNNPWLKPDGMLQRPFTNDDLLNVVRSVLRSGGGSPTSTSQANIP